MPIGVGLIEPCRKLPLPLSTIVIAAQPRQPQTSHVGRVEHKSSLLLNGREMCVGEPHEKSLVVGLLTSLSRSLMTSPLEMARDCYCRVAEDSLAVNECLLLLANSVEGAVMLHLPFSS
jgi:hypothetical protein